MALGKLLSYLSDMTRPYGTLTDEELAQQREKTRLRLFDGEDVYNELREFDEEIRLRYRRAHPEKEEGFPTHTKHGWYLPDDD